MNNIQKNFKQKSKRGLCMAVGGVVDPYEGMAPADVAQYTNDPDALNKASTLKWAADERQRQASHPRQAFLNPAQAAPAPTQPALAAAPAPTAPAPTAPAPAPATTFEQDIGARDLRIRKLRDSLSPQPAFADGGIVGADGLTDAQRAKLSGARASLGVSNAAPAPTPAPAATPAPVRAAPVQQPSVGGAINSIRERQRMLSNLATGGVVGAKTFEFEGKGTGTSDDIPVKVAGNHVNVSKGEKAVILPAKTAKNPQALDIIEDVIEQTNGKPPNRGLRGNFNVGGFVDDYGDLRQPNRFQKAVPNEILRQQVNNAAPGAQLRLGQTRAMSDMATTGRTAGRVAGVVDDFGNVVKHIAPGVDAASKAANGGYGAGMAPPAATPAAPKPSGALRTLGRAATVAGVVGNGIDMATSDIPAEQVAAAIRGVSMANPLLGTAVNVGDALVDKATGGKYNMATGLDAAAKWASDNVPGMRGDYMLPPEFQPGGTGKAAPAAPAEAPTAEEQAANRAVLTPPAPGTTTPANFVPEAVASNAPKLDAEVTRRGLSGLKTIGTVNGDVTTGRDKNGQLHVMAGLDNTDAQNEALRAKEADRMTKDLARQVQVFDGLRAERLQRSPDASERAMGLAQAQQQILQQQNRNTAAHNEATQSDAKEGRSIQRAALEQQNDQFSKTLAANAATAKAAADKASVEDADKLVEESGYKGDDLVEFRDAIRMNTYGGKQLPDGTVIPTAGDFDKMTMAQKRKVLPAIKAAHEYTKVVNAGSISGRSAEFPELQSERPMNFNDVATDPDSFLGLPRWRGKDNKIGVADLIEAKLDPRVNGNMYQFNGGRTVRANAIKGDMGPLKSNDMAALRKTQLERK